MRRVRSSLTISMPFSAVGGEFLRVPESLRILKSDKHEKMDQARRTMRVAFLLFVHLLVNVAKLSGPGGSKGLLAETLLIKHQLIVLNRSRRRAPNLTTWDRFLFGLTGFFVTPARMAKNTVVVSTSTSVGSRAGAVVREVQILSVSRVFPFVPV